MIRITLLSAVVLAVMTTPSRALTITQTQGFGGRPNFDTTVEFDRFDPSFGTLQSVEWQMQLDIEGGSLTVDNDGMAEANVSVQLGAAADADSTGVRLLDGDFATLLSDVSVSTGSDFVLAGDNGDGMTFDPTMPDAATHEGGAASVSTGGFVNATFLEDYVGDTMFSLDVDVDQLIDFGGTGGVSGQFDPVLAFANITLIYEYVPEPSACSAALIGIGVMGLVRRRAK